MKIAAADLSLQSDHALVTRQQSSASLQVWNDARAAASAASISQAARQALAAEDAAPSAPSSADAASATDNDPFLALVKQVIEMLTGQKVRVFDAQSFSAQLQHAETQSTASREHLQSGASARGDSGIAYDYRSTYEETETTRFSASGTVRTADGQEISFSLDLSMMRHYREDTRISLRAGDAPRTDPLVVNFGGTAAQLAAQTDRRFLFDLNGDGRAESLPLFDSGSGYLALDLNGNGRIDSGRELFGPRSGNGFADLAALDSDGNGWIDAADPAFARLAVWTPAATGDGTLTSLGALGIGALALAHAATPFALRGEGNADLGATRASGLFLTEQGQAGSLQEIDLTA